MMLAPTDARSRARRACGELSRLVEKIASESFMLESIGHEGAVAVLTDQVELITAELASVLEAAHQPVIEAQRQQVEAFAASPEPLLINIGSGADTMDGWVNVDLGPADVVADIGRPLPFPDDSASHIYASHIVEHLRFDQALDFLTECRRVLRFAGKIRIVVPNIAAYLRAHLDGDDSFWETHHQYWEWGRDPGSRLAEILSYAGVDIGGDAFFGHRHGYDAASLLELLVAAGFAPVRLCQFQDSPDQVFRVDDTSRVAHVEHDGRPFSLFAEGFSLF